MIVIYDWFEERLEIQCIPDDILAKFVPAHVNIFYCFGGIVLTSFIFWNKQAHTRKQFSCCLVSTTVFLW